MQQPSQNRRILEHIAVDEQRHYEIWKTYTDQDVQPDWLKVWIYSWVCRIFGLSFGLKLMERDEASARQSYGALPLEVKEAEVISREEGAHGQNCWLCLKRNGCAMSAPLCWA
jgi:hypothetical protein